MLTRKLMFTVMSGLLMAVGGVQAGGSAERGQQLITDCVSCHGADGKGSFETPRIAGLDAAYIHAQLKAFQSGERKSLDGIMHLYTEDRSDQDLADLAAYWASVKTD